MRGEGDGGWKRGRNKDEGYFCSIVLSYLICQLVMDESTNNKHRVINNPICWLRVYWFENVG